MFAHYSASKSTSVHRNHVIFLISDHVAYDSEWKRQSNELETPTSSYKLFAVIRIIEFSQHIIN